MSHAMPQPWDSSPTERQPDPLSAEPGKRSVELAFLSRLMDAAKTAGSAVLKRADRAPSSVATSLEHMQNPVFQQAARAMERSMPVNTGFGRFRDEN
ncbi:hypothetical protein CDN98_02215 [Roseateles terrae]|nr:hypothetical protein CDN98_02215 [Roseateles terrae]